MGGSEPGAGAGAGLAAAAAVTARWVEASQACVVVPGASSGG